MTLEWIGLLGSLALLIVLTMRGVDLLLAAPVCAVLLAFSFGLPLFPQLAGEGADNFTTAYMTGFSGFIASWFFVFLLGSVFGKVMEDSGAADSVAQWVVQKFGARHALVAVIGACAVMTYGGVSLFVVAFSVFPLALSLFREAGLPRRFIPGAIGFGSVTFTMTSAGSPEIQNWIPMQYLGTTPYAAWQVSLVVAVLMATVGFTWLRWMIGRAIVAGEAYDARDGDPQPKAGGLPHPATGLIPLAAVLGVAFVLHDQLKQSALIVALLAGVLTVLVVNRNYFINLPHAVSNGTLGALIAIANTAAVVGFGAIAKLSPAFGAAVDSLTSLPGDPLVSASIAVTLIAGLTGSASGGQAIALPILAPHYLGLGVDANALHRVVAIASGGLDSLPHNVPVVR
jgi:H+/gluconate symporter-like permease